MEHPGFFHRAGPFTLSTIANQLGADLAPSADGAATVSDIRTLADAGRGHLTFFDNRKYLPQLLATEAGAVLVAPMFAPRMPTTSTALVLKQPYRGFAQALQLFYPEAMRSCAAASHAGDPLVHPSARIEDGVTIEPGAVVGREAWIGRGTTIAAGAVIGYRVTIGRDCWIGPGASVIHTLVGDRVILHGGVRLGQDGFGFAMGAGGHLKVPQIGRVIIQNDVEIGANTTADRGALNDTVIGEGTKIDNLCQIGHNVRIGRHCVIVAHVAIAGSTVIGDFVVIGGQAGISGHLTVGSGAQIAGASVVKDDVAPKARMVGHPAMPIREWARERVVIRRLVSKHETAATPEVASSDDE
ncbi:MAG: UDP-3-O-(3-hydroxymyristoyl)glucosamine N-acyltransferase [Hyphomicrobiaceae bacterium]|nr:UDP-3-O-(3-hydroxymyristoyl)glucosamine N-acyltransferase [Hyphomicrobiaceae bacterium]